MLDGRCACGSISTVQLYAQKVLRYTEKHRVTHNKGNIRTRTGNRSRSSRKSARRTFRLALHVHSARYRTVARSKVHSTYPYVVCQSVAKCIFCAMNEAILST